MNSKTVIKQDARLIRDLGGPTKVAVLLGYRHPQRVQNWLARGIPSHIKVQRPDLFMPSERTKAA